MAERKRRRGPPIHKSIKKCLGYDVSETDDDVYEDWKERTSRVCKPCWELKYCPYGPLVEQLPLLPPTREGMIKHNEYFKKCLETNIVGEVTPLTSEMRQEYESWIEDEQLLLQQASHQFSQKKRFEALDQIDSDDEKLEKFAGGYLPPVHVYRVPYDLGFNQDNLELNSDDFSQENWKEIQNLVEEQRNKLKLALDSGEIDDRSPLEATRRVYFQEQVDEFSVDCYPESIPPTFEEGCCNIFGHICPVFFAAEIMTETQQERRIGRQHLPFAKMMRIVRRDDYRCQHCQEHLQDTEVEFDHIIPISKGGSSEEHNLRLTCYACNRDKSDAYSP